MAYRACKNERNFRQKERQRERKREKRAKKRGEMKKTPKVNALSAGNEQELICLVISAKAIIYFSKIFYITRVREAYLGARPLFKHTHTLEGALRPHQPGKLIPVKWCFFGRVFDQVCPQSSRSGFSFNFSFQFLSFSFFFSFWKLFTEKFSQPKLSACERALSKHQGQKTQMNGELPDGKSKSCSWTE